VVIVDEFTGRLLPDRSWEQGLHQLIEVKEAVAVTGVNRTLARLTYQSFFARYLRLAGMSGTLKEVARETAVVYRVRTDRVEPNKPMRRTEWPTLLTATQDAKHQAVVEEVARCLARGQPVLVGTRSVQASKSVSVALAAAKITHRVLNALQTADEADLIARAGKPRAVTVATNMAGRGTDIPVDPALIERGGLHVILTEWHESARIDRQLFGRCARQGDPGSCRAIVSLDDEIIQRHGEGVARWVARRWPVGTVPQWGIRLLRNRVQAMAERVNASQRRATMQQDRLMQIQLAFSGTAE
jgi:preprotein translocase subunit SecA